MIIFPETTITWDIVAYDDITAASFAALADAANDVEILLIGCGAQMGMPRADIRDYLKETRYCAGMDGYRRRLPDVQRIAGGRSSRVRSPDRGGIVSYVKQKGKGP